MSPPEEVQLRLPEIDFRRLDPSNAVGGRHWDLVRGQVIQALESHGCFQAIYDGVSPEVKDELFGRLAPELFALPEETKTQGHGGCSGSGSGNGGSRLPYDGYIHIPTLSYQSLDVGDAARLENVDEFARRIWPPDGNETFRDAVWTFAKNVKVLEQIVHRMILQSFGAEKYYDSQVEEMVYGLRMAEYGVPEDQETKIALTSHVDHSMLTIVCQHLAEGLEVQTNNGEWIHVPLLENSYNVMVGEVSRSWSNGRLRPPFHRVRMTGDYSNQLQPKRYSMIYVSHPTMETKVEVLKELVDDEHPPSFKPYRYGEYLRFRFSGARSTEEDALKAFCGVEA